MRKTKSLYTMEGKVSIRHVNEALLGGTVQIIADYFLDGLEKQGRIVRARTRRGITEGKILASGRWATLRKVWTA